MIGTEASRRLCKAIAAQSGGVCFLGFSRGKDAIVAWLWLREYFARIIPFHVTMAPGLSFIEESFAYYESRFATKIERFCDGVLVDSVDRCVYQPIEDVEAIDAMALRKYDNHAIVAALRTKHGLPDAWCAYGINASDSLTRRIYVNKYEGRIERWKSFYPCFDWKRAEILAALEESGIKLPRDYLLYNRSFSGLPEAATIENMRKLMPGDYARLRDCYPLLDAVLARNEFRRRRMPTKPAAKPPATRRALRKDAAALSTAAAEPTTGDSPNANTTGRKPKGRRQRPRKTRSR